jgi:hypothetical protein
VRALKLPQGEWGGITAEGTYGVHALKAPSIWWAIVTLAINDLATTVVFRLVFGALASAVTDPLDIGALNVVRHTARSVVIINFCVVGVATNAVEEWWWLEGREKGGQSHEGVRWGVRDMCERICVQGFRGDMGDE